MLGEQAPQGSYEAHADASAMPATGENQRPPRPEVEAPGRWRGLGRWSASRAARWVGIGLFACAALAVAPLLRALPVDHALAVRLGRPALVNHVDVLWLGADGAAVARTQRFFSHDAPQTVHTKVSLPAGHYEVAVEVALAGATERVSHRVELGGEAGVTVLEVR